MERKIEIGLEISHDNFVDEICHMIKETSKDINIISININAEDMMLIIEGVIINEER